MMIRATLDTRGLAMRLRAMANASPEARATGVRLMGGAVIDTIARTAPRDTNRFVAGWIRAGNAAGVSRLAVPGYNKSSRYSEMHKRLAAAVEDWRWILRTRYEKTGRVDKHKAKAERQLQRAEQRLKDFLSNESGAVIGFNLYGGGRQFSARHKLYGGRGRIVRIGDRTLLELTNLEPHTTLVERKTRVMARAVSVLKGAGLRRAGRGYIDKQAAAFNAGR